MEQIFKSLKNYCLDYKIRKSNAREIYYIDINNEIAGFFALLRTTLDFCCYADENGFIPYIRYSNKILYSENTVFDKGNNPYEYYFEQPVSLKVWDLLKKNVIKSQSMHSDSIELKYNLKKFSYLMEDVYIAKMAEIYKKYIRLNAQTHRMIWKSIKNILKGKRTLGVHMRGTDFYKGFNNHPIPVSVDEYINVIESEVCKYGYEQIFLATDDERCLKELKKRIQIPIVYYKNVLRSSGSKSVAFERNERRHNNYLLGLEVLRDVYTLVACEGFVGCLSQVDILAQIIKRSEGKEFVSMNIIDKGIFSNNKPCWEPMK